MSGSYPPAGPEKEVGPLHEVVEMGIVGGTGGNVHYVKMNYDVKAAKENPLAEASRIRDQLLAFFSSK